MGTLRFAHPTGETFYDPRTDLRSRPSRPHGIADAEAGGEPEIPHKHAIQQTFFLYVREPGGNRVEVANAGARLILAPDWKPIVWTEEERKKGQAWGLKTIESFHTHGTPPLPGTHGDETIPGRDDLSEMGEPTCAGRGT